MAQKVKVITVIESDGVEYFERLVNSFCAKHNVFATQSHIGNDDGCIKLYAILFYREG